MTEKTQQPVAYIWLWEETMWESIVTDTYTYGGLVVSILVGWFIGSDALQWIAGIMFILAVISTAIANPKRRRMSLAQAKAYIAELETKQ